VFENRKEFFTLENDVKIFLTSKLFLKEFFLEKKKEFDTEQTNKRKIKINHRENFPESRKKGEKEINTKKSEKSAGA
jgi:hypothetical protein